MKGHDGSLAQAISAVEKVIGEVNTQAKQVEKEIHAACEKLREMVNEREAQLLSEVETVRHEKEKELVSQKHHLEFLLVGIRESTAFGEVLVKEGSESGEPESGCFQIDHPWSGEGEEPDGASHRFHHCI